MAVSESEDEYGGDSLLDIDASTINNFFDVAGGDGKNDIEILEDGGEASILNNDRDAPDIDGSDEIPSSVCSRGKENGDGGDAGALTSENTNQADLIPLVNHADFGIPPAVLNHALSLKRKGRPPYWSHRMYRDAENNEVQVHYSENYMQSEALARKFLHEPLLGFDMEWRPRYKPGIKYNISLIQLASERHIGLFHIARHYGNKPEQLLAPTLRKILESPMILKTGVNILGADGSRLKKYFRIRPQGLFELSHLHNLLGCTDTGPEVVVSKSLVGMAKLVNHHLQLPLFKGKVRTSDWSKGRLSDDQMNYAASDAYAGYQLFRVMDEKRKLLLPTPPLPAPAELQLPIRLVDEVYQTSPLEETHELSEAVAADQSTSKRANLNVEDSKLLQALKEQRQEISQQQNTPHFIIAPDSVLQRLALERPTDLKSLLKIRGIGPVKAEKYGEKWLSIIKHHTEGSSPSATKDRDLQAERSHPVVVPDASPSPSSPTKSNKRRQFIPPAPLAPTTPPSSSLPLDQTQQTARKMLQSALSSLRIRLATKAGTERDEVASEDLLRAIAASVSSYDSNSMAQIERIEGWREFSRVATACGVDVFEFLRKHAPGAREPLKPLSSGEWNAHGEAGVDGEDGGVAILEDDDDCFEEVAFIVKRRRL